VEGGRGTQRAHHLRGNEGTGARGEDPLRSNPLRGGDGDGGGCRARRGRFVRLCGGVRFSIRGGGIMERLNVAPMVGDAAT
jgi:hypothetical protein